MFESLLHSPIINSVPEQSHMGIQYGDIKYSKEYNSKIWQHKTAIKIEKYEKSVHCPNMGMRSLASGLGCLN